jgi:hypothetical protein
LKHYGSPSLELKIWKEFDDLGSEEYDNSGKYLKIYFFEMVRLELDFNWNIMDLFGAIRVEKLEEIWWQGR